MALILLILTLNFILLLYLLFKTFHFNKKNIFNQLMSGIIALIALITLCEIEITRASESYLIYLSDIHVILAILIILFSVNANWSIKNHHDQKRGIKSNNFNYYLYQLFSGFLIFEFFRSDGEIFTYEKVNGLWTYQVVFTHYYNWIFAAWLVLSLSLIIFFVFKAYLKTTTKRNKEWMWRLGISLTIFPLGMFFFFFLSNQTPKYYLISPIIMMCAYAWLLAQNSFKLFKNSPHKALNEILKTIPSIILIVDLKYRISYINSEGQEALNTKNESLINRSIFDLINSLQLDFCSKEEIESIEKGSTLKREVKYLEEYFFEVKVKPIFNKNKNKTGYLIVGHDTSSFRREEKDRILAYNLLKQSNQELERFAYIASHDLKTPLRNILSFNGLMERAIKMEEYEELPEYMNYIKLYSNSMFQVVQDVLEMSKVNNQHLKLEEVDMNNVITTIKDYLKEKIQRSNAKVLHTPLPIIRADKSQIIQVFQNLVENGLKYNKSKSPTIWIDYIEDNQYHQFSVSDNGIGISKEYHKKVFEMFKRLHTIDKYEGSGIGLALCKKIIEVHKGKIHIQAAEQGGTKIICQLPKMPIKEQQQATNIPFIMNQL